jgi:hypothetical protein
LHEAPTFAMEEFDSKTTDDYDFWMNFRNHIEYPPDPSFPLTVVDDEVDPDYFFNDLNDRYRLTEEGIHHFHHSFDNFLDCC